MNAFDRITRIESDFRTARFALELVRHIAYKDPTTIEAAWGLRTAALRSCRESLEPTYIVRMFAEFECVTRRIIAAGRAARTAPEARPATIRRIVDRIASRYKVPAGVAATVHEIRRYRNGVVHAQPRSLPSIAIDQCARGLRRFLSWLPRSILERAYD